MFKLFFILAFIDASGELQTRNLEYRLPFATLSQCQEQMRETMTLTDEIADAGGAIVSVAYSCIYDLDARNTETEA